MTTLHASETTSPGVDVMTDLAVDARDLDQLVAEIEETTWDWPTPAPGWTIKHQVGHLAFIFRIAGLAAAEPDQFRQLTSQIGDGFDAAVNSALEDYLCYSPADLLGRWRRERDRSIEALSSVPQGHLVPWLVNPLPAPVLASAGMMELFGHGQDIADALGVSRQRTDRLFHLVDFIVRTKDFGYFAWNLTPSEDVFHFEVTAPSGDVWTFGPADASQHVTGPAIDLCLLATRRRHRDDLALTAIGTAADHWLDIAQAYRGPAGPGRQPGQFGGN